MAKKKVTKKRIKKFSRWQAVPLKGRFMVTAILGVLLSKYYVYPVSYNLGIASMLVFGIMFFAAVVSMTLSPIPHVK